MRAYKIIIKWHTDRNGRFRMWSDDVPGLNLASADIPALMDDVAKAIAVLLELNKGFDVIRVRPLFSLDGDLMDRSRWWKRTVEIEYVVIAGIKQ